MAALLNGAPPAVNLTVSSDLFDRDPDSADAAAIELRPDDRRETFAFEPNNPQGPYKGTSPADDPRIIALRAEIGLKAGRALREDEGLPIERIRTPGQPVDQNHPVDIHIDVSG